MGLITRLARETLDLFFPPVCLLCEQRLAVQGLCEGCLEGLNRIHSPRCSVCGVPFGNDKGPDRPCAQCLKKRPPFVSARSALYYNDAASLAIRRFKYHGDSSLAIPFSALMTEAMGKGTVDLIVPVPLHKKRLRQRGFNQSLILARALSKSTGIEVDYKCLKRIRHTLPQVELKEDERLVNVKGAFKVMDISRIKGKRMLLVDDVYTTGATVRECSSALKKAGAIVHVLTIARAHKV
ncbi:MAG: ComF family protein [Deltaproteobacteria bacterium]|nr:ComF family protein [Deltaproteobacteria bacterium]